MRKPERQFLTPPEFAERLGVNADRVRGWIESGQLAAINVGDRQRPRWRLSPDAIDAFLASRASQSRRITPTRRRIRPTDVHTFV